jgi:hypothetical protein
MQRGREARSDGHESPEQWDPSDGQKSPEQWDPTQRCRALTILSPDLSLPLQDAPAMRALEYGCSVTRR